jgi:hypothetical protein
MHSFFADPEKFVQDLRARADRPDRCWSCCRTGGHLTDFNIHKDCTTLGLRSQGCDPRVTLCLRCSVRYMNSFNDRNHSRQGKKGTAFHWTLESFTAFRASRLGALT